MSKKLRLLSVASVAGASMMMATSATADVCADVSFVQFQAAVQTAYAETNQFGFGLPMWATLINHTGKVCYVYSVKGGDTPADNGGPAASRHAWLGSRVISAQKANTANAFSLNTLAISTGALSALVYPGGSLYGLQHSNPVDSTVSYAGNPALWGTATDGLVGKQVGGVNVFGGGVALYNDGGAKVGAVGASGDTSCRDHTLAYRLRIALAAQTGGTADTMPNDDGLSFVATPAALFEQPTCGVSDPGVYANADWSASDFGSR